MDDTERCLCPEPGPNDIWVESYFEGPNGVSITTEFYFQWVEGWPKIYHISRFVETVIEGYTSQPIILHGYYSQSYASSHHNSSDCLLYEPQLEPGISEQILDELRAQDRRLFLVKCSWSGVTITTYGFDDELFIPGDIEPDGDVDFVDFANFAERWLENVCDACNGADLTGDGRVNWDDMLEFTDNWLAGL